MRKISYFCLLVCLCRMINAQQVERATQTVDSILINRGSSNIRQLARQAVTTRFPTTRFLDIQYDYLSPKDYRWKLYKQPYENGRLQAQNRVTVAMNIPLFRKNKFTLTGSLRYRYEAANFNDVEMVSATYPERYHDDVFHSHYWLAGVNATYFSRLFGKPAFYNLSVDMQGSQEGVERFSAFALANVVVVRNQKTTLTVGLAGFINSTFRIPVLPGFSVDHKFTPTFSFSTVLPRFAYFRKSIGTSGRLSIGSEFDANSYFIYPKGLSKTYLFRRNEFKSGAVYEHYLNNRIILTCKTGVVNTIARLQPVNRTSKHKILTGKEDANFYFNIGFSYNLY